MLLGILRCELARERVPCTVREFSNRRPKDTRILEAFDALLAARRLNVHDSVRKTPFITEMQEWRPGGRGHDDGLDAVAGALSLAPSRHRIRRAYYFCQATLAGCPERIRQVKTDFEGLKMDISNDLSWAGSLRSTCRALAAVLWLIWRTRREQGDALQHLRDIVDARNAQLREALTAFKLEVAKSYASITVLPNWRRASSAPAADRGQSSTPPR